MNDNKAIQLTDRFFNGETTLGEEQELYAYFLSGKVCPQLMPSNNDNTLIGLIR